MLLSVALFIVAMIVGPAIRRCTVWLAATETVCGLTTTAAAGPAVTVTLDAPLFVSLVAVIVAVPVASVETRPDVDTVAIRLSLVLQVTVRSVTTVPLTSFTVAASCTV